MTKIFIILCTCLLAACGGNSPHPGHEGHENEHEHESEHDGGETDNVNPSTVVFDKERAEAVGLKTQIVQPSVFTEAIKTGGRILAAQGDEQTLVATLPGVVALKSTAFAQGATVKKGQAVLSLLTGNLPDGDVAVRTRAAYEKAKSEYDRAQELIKDRIISEKDFNQAVLDYETAKTAFDAIGGMKNVGTKTDGTKNGGVDICSPISGYLKNLRVKEGDYVETGAPLATVSQNSRLQLRVELPEKYYASLPLIQSACFRTSYSDTLYRLQDLNGRLLSYARSMDSDAFYVPVIFEFDNKGAILPGGYVEAYLLTTPAPGVIAIPVSSLIEEQGIYSVYIMEDEDCYRKQEVRLGAGNGYDVQILAGIEAGDVVVTEAAYHLKLASATTALPSHHH
ncbi:MAG: efflux RND transporter periplasmic adaptor subunit [Tannerellaceae bacterium]|jgi:RND family efflux transporter MFP subunit|nr:efflux RND transporter periplasmic adaptor subunit [Tannerellaceae bacterium]